MIGEFLHTIDAKGRCSLPAKFREELGAEIVVSKGLDDCLFVFSLSEWEKFKEKVLAMPFAASRKPQRYFLSSAHNAEIDKLGRILIPAVLRDFAHIEKDITINGVSSRAEIWNRKTWEDYSSGMASDGIADMLEQLDF